MFIFKGKIYWMKFNLRVLTFVDLIIKQVCVKVVNGLWMRLKIGHSIVIVKNYWF